MANLQETATWESGIYQLEVTDPVLGGPEGPDNRAPRQLANRTLFLKGQVDTLRTSLQQTNTNVSNLGTSKEDKSTVAALATRIAELEKKSAVFSAGGGMVLWQKPANQIPAGWVEVVNWRGRLPMGHNPNDPDFSIGATGGNKNKRLFLSEIPPHNHGTNARSLVWQTSSIGVGTVEEGQQSPNYTLGFATIDQAGGSGGTAQEFSLLNPYRVVMFIEYVG